jgi:Asp-tRNA(Asn)/Glu-tRNA(Gln) amidotransferase A subunit family amidase
MELWQLTAGEASARMSAGTLSSEAYIRACLARIAERDPTVQAWAHLDPDGSQTQARA